VRARAWEAEGRQYAANGDLTDDRLNRLPSRGVRTHLVPEGHSFSIRNIQMANAPAGFGRITH
jgi:hypothetical protein